MKFNYILTLSLLLIIFTSFNVSAVPFEFQVSDSGIEWIELNFTDSMGSEPLPDYLNESLINATIQGLVNDTYVNEDGDTMTGNLNINANLTVDTNTLYVDKNNDGVGIGQSSPQAPLHISEIYNGNNGNLRLDSQTWGAFQTIYDGGTRQMWLGYSSGDSYIALAAEDGNELRFYTNLNERMNIEPAGDVNILNNLNVDGVITGNTTMWNQTGTDVYLADSSGELGVGTNSPTKQLQIVGGDGAGVRLGTASSYFDITRNGATGNLEFEGSQVGFRDFNFLNGQVGIGTTSPTDDLNVVGSANFSEGDFHWEKTGTGQASVDFGTAASGAGSSITFKNSNGKAGILISGTVGAGFGYDDSGTFAILAEDRADIDSDSAGTGYQVMSFGGNPGYNIGLHGSPLASSTLTVYDYETPINLYASSNRNWINYLSAGTNRWAVGHNISNSDGEYSIYDYSGNKRVINVLPGQDSNSFVFDNQGLRIRTKGLIGAPVEGLNFNYDGTNYNSGIETSFNSASQPDNEMIFNVCDKTQTGQTEVMTLEGTGYVGIGTRDPANFLHIDQSSANVAVRIDNSLNTGYTETQFKSNAKEYRIGVGGSASTSSLDNDFYIYDNDNAAARLLIDSTGNVGVATYTPQAQFTVGDVWTAQTNGGKTPLVKFSGADQSTTTQTILRLNRPVYGGLYYAGSVDFDVLSYGVGGAGVDYAPKTQFDIRLKNESDVGDDATVHLMRMRDDQSILLNGTVDIENTLTLSNGTNTSPPLKFQQGNLLSTPESGSMEYDGDRFYLTETSNQRRVISIASDVVVDTINVTNTATETELFAVTIQPEDVSGKYYRIPIFGEVSTATVSDSFIIRIKTNGDEKNITFTPRVVTNEPWHLTTTLIIRDTGEIGNYSVFTHAEIADESYDVRPLIGTVNTTKINTINITMQWDTAKAGNSLLLYGGILEDMN